MTAILTENFRKVLAKNYPQYTLCLNSLKEIYKRTTILSHEEASVYSINKRTNVVETFKKFTRKLLPEMEKTIEMNLLKNRFEQIKDPRVKESILQAYHKRNLMRFAYAKEITDYQYYPPDIIATQIIEPRDIFM